MQDDRILALDNVALFCLSELCVCLALDFEVIFPISLAIQSVTMQGARMHCAIKLDSVSFDLDSMLRQHSYRKEDHQLNSSKAKTL